MGDQALEVATQYGNIDPASDEEDIGDKDEGVHNYVKLCFMTLEK